MSLDAANRAGLHARGVSVSYRTNDGLLSVVRDIDLSVLPGDSIGIVGESGSGKSTLALALAGLLRRDEAEITADQLSFDGEDIRDMKNSLRVRILGRRIAFVFQNPHVALNPVLTIGRQLTDHLRWHKQLGSRAAKVEAIRLLEEVGIPDASSRLDGYPHEYSGGMLQRATIAMALACDPDLLIADEPTTALDASVQADIVELVERIRKARRLSLVWITHDLALLRQIVEVVAVMYAGRLVEIGPSTQFYEYPRHPYTRALLDTVRGLWSDTGEAFRTIEGQPPSSRDLPGGCAFRARCPRADARCTSVPPLTHTASDQRVACWNPCEAAAT